MLKFLYMVTDEDYSFIHVWKIRRNQKLEDGKTFRYTIEDELKDYIEKYPHSVFTYSTWIEKLKMKKIVETFQQFNQRLKHYNCL